MGFMVVYLVFWMDYLSIFFCILHPIWKIVCRLVEKGWLWQTSNNSHFSFRWWTLCQRERRGNERRRSRESQTRSERTWWLRHFYEFLSRFPNMKTPDSIYFIRSSKWDIFVDWGTPKNPSGSSQNSDGRKVLNGGKTVVKCWMVKMMDGKKVEDKNKFCNILCSQSRLAGSLKYFGRNCDKSVQRKVNRLL